VSVAVGVAAAAIVVLVLAVAAVSYNRLVRDRNRARYAWADVDALLVRRADLIPRLAAIAAAALRHERETLEAVARARARVEAAGGGPSAERAGAEAALGAAGGRLVVLVEAQPELRASDTTRELIAALRDVEGDLARARTVYNRTVQTYEDRRRAVPGVLVASVLGLRPQAYWRTDDAATA
jgi:LemA protein